MKWFVSDVDVQLMNWQLLSQGTQTALRDAGKQGIHFRLSYPSFNKSTDR